MSAPTKRALLFFLALLVACTLLMWPAPRLEAAWGRLFAKMGNALIAAGGGLDGLLGSDGTAKLVADYDRNSQHDIQIQLVNIPRAKAGGSDFLGTRRTSSRHLGYMPAATLLALVLATPIRWRRKLWAVLIGEALVGVFVALRIALVLADGFRGSAPYSLYQLRPPWDNLFDVMIRIVAVEPATTYWVPLLIWLVVTFRREDVVAWRRASASGAPVAGLPGGPSTTQPTPPARAPDVSI